MIFGVVLISYSNMIKEYTVRYDNSCGKSKTCTVTLNISEVKLRLNLGINKNPI